MGWLVEVVIMYFKHHPNEWEGSWNADIFCEENLGSLRELFDRVIDYLPSGSHEPGNIAVIMSCCLRSEEYDLEEPPSFDEEDGLLLEIVQGIWALVHLLKMEDQGLLYCGDDGRWGLTELGHQYATNITGDVDMDFDGGIPFV